MANANKSKNHHWWPVGLQQYWADRREDLSWIEPDGTIQKKRPANRKIGYKRYGHTILRGSVWESNFESEFDVDNEVHDIVTGIRNLKPFGRTPSEFYTLLKLFLKKDRTLRDICKFYHLDEKLRRNLLLLMHSLLIRSPASRSKYEAYPSMMDLPPNEDVGKGNMLHSYRIAKKLCHTEQHSNQYFVLLHSPLRKFIFGDGSLDWLTGGLLGTNRISGRALLPLTPHICVYFCTPIAMGSTTNCASLSAPPWMVEWVNQITQIYSKEKLFFLGRPPKLIDAFRQRQFLEHSEKTDALIDMLDQVADDAVRHGILSMGRSGH
ncbi:hypothetical protein [Hoeflea alexandrii]